MDDNKRKLYDALSKDYDMGTFEQFSTDIKDAGKRQKLYDAIKEEYDLPDFKGFSKQLGVAAPISQEQMQNSLQQRMYPNGQVPTEPIVRDEAQPAPQQEATPQQQQSTGGYKPTWQEQMAFGSTLGRAQYAVDNATTGIDQMEQASKQASPFGSGNVGIGNNQSLRKGKQTFDAEKGAFVDTYLTSDGREFRDLQQANNAQADLDKIADSVRYEESLKAIGIDPSINLNDPNNLNHMLGDAYAERDAILKKMKDDKEGEQAVRDLIMSGGYDPTPNDKVDNRKTYQSALRMLERRINALETARDNGGFWGGTADVLSDPSNYSFGLTDLEDSKQMAKIKEKIDAARANGTKPQLSDSEKALARNYMLNQQAEQLNKDNWWYNAGKSFGQTLSFMKDFAITGGGFASIAKGGLAMGGAIGKKTAAKVLGEYMTKNIGTKALGKAIEYTGKGIGLAAGAEAGGFMLNNTVQAASNAADVINKQAGNLTVGKDGNLTFEGGKNLGMAVLKSQIERTGQNGSELVGLAFDAMPGIIGKVVQRTTVGKAIKKLTDNALWKKGEGLLNYLGVSSVWGEGMEEEYDMARTEILNRLTNEEYAPEGSGLFDLDRQIDTWKTVGLTSMILRVPSMVVSGTQAANYYANQYNLNASDKNMRSVFGDYDRYESVKSAIDGADNANIAGVLSGLITNAELSNEEKQAMFFYANDLIKVRGFNIGNVVAAVNGYTAPPKVASYQVKADGKSFDELDENGNVLAHHEYETNDEMKAGLYELQQQRFDDNLQSDISIMKTRPNGQFDQLVSDYLMQNEIFMMPSDFEAILNKPSLERTEEEQQLVAPFSELLHNTVYDNTMLHEEQSQQDGEEIADADSIDIEAGSEQGAAINTEWQAAQQARNELFSRNEELAQEVLSRENNGLSHQEIISSLTTFRPEDVQAVIDFYNKKARYEGYINRKAQKIDEAAANSRQRHTMKGTIDGVADVNNVHTITDGNNRYYLVSGDITTDPATGRITGSTSGLIIGMDLDGSFVNLNESDGYSLEPVTMTLDQFEEAERTRLQEHITYVIDPNGLMNPQAEQPQPMNSGEQAGAQAGASTGTGANEAPAAPLSSEPQQPQVTIESVTDKDGIKRYEQGIPVDAAIADIQNDGFDVNELADASIAEAQQAIEKIDKKSAKTRKDLMDKKSQQATIDYYNNVKARWAEMNAEAQPAESEEIVNNQPKQPVIEEKPVSSQQSLTVEEQKQQQIEEAKAKYGELFDDDFAKANDVYELVSMWVGRKRNLAWDDVNGKRGLQKELGWTRKIGGDTKYIETLLAKNGEGMGVDEFAHMVWESEENTVDGEKRYTTEEIKEALLELLKSAGSKSDVVDHALNTRINAAEAAMQEQQKRDEEKAQELQPLEPLTAEQLADIENNLPFAQSTDEEIEDAPINQLRREVDVLMQEDGMPPIQLVDTERMTNDEWVELLSDMMGYFLSQEEVEEYIDTILNDGVYYNPETGSIVVFSGNQTSEEVRAKVEQIKEELSNGRSTEEENGGLETKVIQRPSAGNAQEDSAESEEETGSTSTASQGSTEPRVDDYLKPRNAEEEAIVQGVINQLQQEIQTAIDEENKARADLEKARTKESDRATDMFANDESFAEPDAIFSQEEMGLDTSAEGVERRTAAQRERLQEAVNKKNQLQSEQERNSRVRGALDNHRRQTKIDTDNPIEAIEQSAQSFAQEQQETINKRKERWQGKKEPAYGADNKLVTTDRYEELKKRMKEKLRGQANMGFDPEILAIGTEMAVYHIEAGARKFTEFAQHMIEELGDAIRPYLKAIYNGAREMPGMEELRKQMTSYESVSLIDVQNIPNTNDNTVNEHKEENNETENVVSSQQETSVEVERKPEDADKYRAFSQAVANDMLDAMETGEKPYKSINDIRKKAKQVGLEVDDEGRTDILLQELVEDGLVSAARQYVNTYMVQQMLAGKKAEEARTSRDLFNDIVKLYYLQPTISQRSSNRIKMQQYSTPLPMSFAADVFATPNKNDGTVLEPTAGNGMMVFAVPEYMVHANELDKTRLDNLRAQKFQKVTDQDATQPFEGDEQYDAIIANPPFGSAPAKDYDGKEIRGLDEQIALNVLSKMKDDGKAAIIIGGNMEYAPNGAIKSDKAFFTYLYDHYNVKGVIDMDGKLYARQGTTYPTRLILIDGRRSEEERAQSKIYPPTLEKRAGYKVNTFDELYDLAEQIRNNDKKTDGTEILRTPTGIALPDNNDASGNTDGGERGRQPRQNDTDGGRTESRRSNKGSQEPTDKGTQKRGGSRTVGVQQPRTPGLFDTEENPSQPQPQTGGNRQGGSTVNHGESRPADVQGERAGNGGVGLTQPKETPKSAVVQQPAQPVKPKVEEKRELNTEKLSYRPHNTAFSLQSVAPAAMVEAMDSMLSKIEKEHGSIDAWVTTELGYDSVEDMHNALAAEQVDSVAMAIYQMQHGQGMIIGDQTGVGKGRQMAALIRWACKQGKKPVFITQKADLFSDIYRDLVDIGSGELRPFIFNADGAMVDNNGVTVHKPLSAPTQAKVFAGDKLPDGYDFAVLTYSQVNTGDQISQDEAKQAAKDKGERYQKKKKEGKPKATPKATFLRALAKDNYMFLDESHTAAGKSNTGYYFQSILKTAKAVTFASATFAKRPDTMPMYAIRTAMAKAKVKAEELIKIIENGGVTLQEIMSRALTQAGQMVRRERDMSDVVTDWKTVDDPAIVKKARDNYDSTIEAFNAIIDFQKNWVAGYLDRLSADLADVAASADMRQGTEDLGIKNVPFASKTYNYTKQLMLALKVDAIVDEVVKEIEAGRHPVIALENTMGSMLDDYAPGDTLEETTFAASLLKGLKGVLRYTITDEDGKQQQLELTPEQLGPDGAAAYHEVEDLIRESTSGIFVSPLDAITEKLKQKGYKVGELTGRQQYVELDENTGNYVVRRRTDRDKKKMQREFNNGTLDVLILNKSASTGISLHASEKFSDQRQRTMIIAQPLADINDYMQMIGRIDRTGQVHRGYYINLGLPVPAEGRFLMMLSTKLKSLNANTTTSQENESSDVEAPDLLNKYGSKVVIEYLRDNPDIYVKMGEPLKRDRAKVSVGELDSYEAQEDDARKITGYVALLPTDEQDAFYNDVVRRYNDLIKYLNDTGSNDLKISVLPLRARTIDKQVSSEGADPKGDNPFAGHAYVDWVDMDVLKKPMKAAEVGKVIEQLNPSENRVRQILDTVERETQAKLDKENERYEAAKKRAEEDIEAKAETINKQQKRTEEQKKEAIDKYASDRRQSVEESHNNMVNKIETSRDSVKKYLEMFRVGDSVLVPDDLTIDTFMGSSPAIFCGFKAKDEGITPSTTLAVFATLDGRRKIEVKLSDWGALTRIDNMTQQNWDAAHNVTLSNWDSQIPSETRKHGFIMTGNILQAFADAGDNGRVPGQLVTYTDIDGNVHDGILMNQHWEPSQLKGSTVPLRSRMEEIKNLPYGDHIISADGNVVIERSFRYYSVSVPKSKKVGGQYYENKALLDLVSGNDFYPSRGTLKGDIAVEDIEKVVEVLSDLGVQVKSDSQVHFDTETEMGQAMASGRFNNSQNSLSHRTETNDSEEKSVPLERRTLKSYTDNDGEYHKGIEEELSELEDRISGAGEESTGVLQEGKQGNAGVQSSRPSVRRLNDLRKQAAQIRAEIARRDQKKQELRQKYDINEKGDISLDNLSRMFHDLNSNKVLGKLFDKVVAVLKNLGVDFRFTDKLDANTGGDAIAFINITFYNWDAQLRDLDNQEKARILLHEMIHNVSSHIIDRYKNPSLGKLSAKQERLAKEIINIYNKVKAANPVRKNGKSPYGLNSEYEMLSELANPEFRNTLDSIPYSGGVTVLQKIKQWFRKLFGINTALDSLEDALDNILESYDENGKREYRQQREGWETQVRNSGVNMGYVDFWEAGLGILGRQSIVEDKKEVERLENEPTEKGYRTVVQNQDGSFGSPMASKLGGKKGKTSKPTSSYHMNQWERSEENPQLATDNGKINLIKPDGLGSVGNVDYNPYIHIRENKLNKQFKNAWERPNLVYIEVEYPKSEMTSGYRAEKAAKTVGRHKWPGGDLILSRWDKPVRIVPWEEVADDWVQEFGKRGVEFDIVSPHLLPILVERGVEILPPHKNMGEGCQKAYEEFKAKQDIDPMNILRREVVRRNKASYAETDPMEAIRRSARQFHNKSNINNPSNPLSYSAKQVYNDRLNRVETVFSEAYQDAMVSLKTAQNAIAKDNDIPDSQNAYMAENLMHGKNKNEQDLFNREYRDPLIATINKIMNLTGMSWGDVDRYVYTKSGLERNRELFVRDWLTTERNKTVRKYEDLNTEEQNIYDSMAATIEDMFEDGDIDEEEKNKKLAQALQKAHQNYVDDLETRWVSLKNEQFANLRNGDTTYADYLNALSDFIISNIDYDYNPEEHDYSGFRAMYGDEEGNYNEDAIIEELMVNEDIIGEDNVNTIWEQINAATQYGLERYREAGMRSDEDIDRVEQMFHFYVPMRGFKAETGEDMYQYFTGKDKSKSYVGGLLKHAKGRGSEAEYPISTIFAMSYKAIADCNQNLVNQKFYRLCQANPNDLVVLSDSWAVYDEVEGIWKESVPEIGDDMSEEEVRETTLAWEEQMRQLALERKAKKITGKAEFDYKPMDKKNQSEHIVDVRINGQPKKMVVTSNPRMAQALNGQLRFEHGRNVFSRWNAAIKNMMASLFTSYSPTFALRNMARDWTHFRMMLGVREGHDYAQQANKYYRQSLFKMVGLFKKYRNGTLDESKEIERDFKDFMDNGGITGFVFMQKIDDIQKEMEKLYKQQKQGKTIRLNNKLWEYTLGAIEAVNEGIENNARFATYRASRHYAGRTKARSAYDAKEITVNFNRKGAGSKTAGYKSQNKAAQDAAKAFGVTAQILGEGKIFFNATVQAIATTFKNFQNADGSLNKKYIAKWAAKYALPPFMFGMLLPFINKALSAALGGGDDDDPYANLAEWTRRKNLCIYIGNGNFLTIPIGQELAAFLTLGDIVAGNTYAPNLKPVDKSWDDEMLGVMNTFSPIDVDTKMTRGGFAEDPISEVAGRTFSVLAPLVAVEQNLGWTGRPIYKEDRFPNDKYKPEYQQVYQSTNPVLVGASKALHELGGGNDRARGKEWSEINPAIIQYLWEQYTGGPGKVFSNTISIGKDAKDLFIEGEMPDFNMRKVEGLKAFVQQGDDRTQYYRTQAKFFKYQEDANKFKYDHDITKLRKQAKNDPAARLELKELSKTEEYQRFEIIEQANRSSKKEGKVGLDEFRKEIQNTTNRKEKREKQRTYNELMKGYVDLLDKVGK